MFIIYRLEIGKMHTRKNIFRVKLYQDLFLGWVDSGE